MGLNPVTNDVVILQGVDAKAGGVDQAASRVCRSGDRQSCRRRGGGGDRRTLPERIREAERDDDHRHE